MDEYFGVAKDVGITREEIETVQSIVMAVAGGQVRAQFLEARMQGAERRRAQD
jgi:hypothetical protein